MSVPFAFTSDLTVNVQRLNVFNFNSNTQSREHKSSNVAPAKTGYPTCQSDNVTLKRLTETLICSLTSSFLIGTSQQEDELSPEMLAQNSQQEEDDVMMPPLPYYHFTVPHHDVSTQRIITSPYFSTLATTTVSPAMLPPPSYQSFQIPYFDNTIDSKLPRGDPTPYRFPKTTKRRTISLSKRATIPTHVIVVE